MTEDEDTELSTWHAPNSESRPDAPPASQGVIEGDQVKAAWQGVIEGDEVEAIHEFESDNKRPVTIQGGVKGTVVSIDVENDFKIEFGNQTVWLLKKHFDGNVKCTSLPKDTDENRLTHENHRLTEQNKRLNELLGQYIGVIRDHNQKVFAAQADAYAQNQVENGKQTDRTYADAARNIVFGVFLSAGGSMFLFILLRKGFSYAPGLIKGCVWLSMIGCWVTLLMFLVMLCFDTLNTPTLIVAMLSAFFSSVQFQSCLVAYAFIYPALTEAVPFAQLDMVLAANTWNMSNMSSANTSSTNISCTSSMAPSTLNEDLEWKIERVGYGGKSVINSMYGNQDFYVIKPEWVAILAHCAPLLAGLTYVNGIGTLKYASLASLVIDFIDVQDFYLLLLEDDIAAGFWSGGGRPSIDVAGANFGIKDVDGYNYSTKGKLFGADFQTQNVFLRFWFDWMLGLSDTTKTRNPYYNSWFWWRIMIEYVIASLYVCLLPLSTFLFQELPCDDFRADPMRCHARIQLLETVLSLLLVEIPFLWMRLLASQYFGVLMSSLCIKNCVSIVADILKICLLLCGSYCECEPEDDDNELMLWAKGCGRHTKGQLVAFSEFVGEDVLKDTEEARKIQYGICYCGDVGEDYSRHSDRLLSAYEIAVSPEDPYSRESYYG